MPRPGTKINLVRPYCFPGRVGSRFEMLVRDREAVNCSLKARSPESGHPANGTMNITQPWNIVFFVGLVVYVGIRNVFIKRTKHEPKSVRRMDRLEKVLLAGMLPAVMLLPLLYLFTPLFAFADYGLPTVVPWIGSVTLVASLWLFWRSHSDLGLNWSVSLELRENHELITRGVYRRVRHPMYSSIWLWALAQGMMLPNWLAGWAVVPAFAAMYFLRMPREEGLMCEKFGDEYRAYMRQTGRLFPGWKLPPAD
jgi:protein-S-isoprenylcysteine O-methyltransferase Ste14